MGRKKQFKKEEALDAAMRVFWEKGYEATSMQALEDTMGLKRTSIYNTFGNKRALFQSVLKHYVQTVLYHFDQALNKARDTEEAVDALFHETIAHNYNPKYPGGCLVVLSVLESHQHDTGTYHMLEEILQGMNQALITRLKQGVAEGELTPDTPIQQLGEQISAMLNGITVMAKARFSEANLRKVAASSTKTLLDTYLVSPK